MSRIEDHIRGVVGWQVNRGPDGNCALWLTTRYGRDVFLLDAPDAQALQRALLAASPPPGPGDEQGPDGDSKGTQQHNSTPG